MKWRYKGLIVNSRPYQKHLEKERLPDIESIMKRNNWVFILDRSLSHRSNLAQEF